MQSTSITMTMALTADGNDEVITLMASCDCIVVLV